jgi:hypothetical protein
MNDRTGRDDAPRPNPDAPADPKGRRPTPQERAEADDTEGPPDEHETKDHLKKVIW